MTKLNSLKVGLAIIGLVLWGYGVRVDHNGLRWTGVGFLAAAVVLRFVKRESRKPHA